MPNGQNMSFIQTSLAVWILNWFHLRDSMFEKKMIKLDSLKPWYWYLTNMLVQTQWQKSTIVVAPSRTQLLKCTVQSKDFLGFFTSIHVCLFVYKRGKILQYHGQLWARALGHSPMNETAIWNKFAWSWWLSVVGFNYKPSYKPCDLL